MPYPRPMTPLSLARDEQLELVKQFWRMVQEEQQYCESRHCTGGRSACVRLKDRIETRFSDILARGRNNT